MGRDRCRRAGLQRADRFGRACGCLPSAGPWNLARLQVYPKIFRMSLLVLIPLSICMGLVGLVAFVWALRHDQFEDLEGNAARVLIPDEKFNDTDRLKSDSPSDHEN